MVSDLLRGQVQDPDAPKVTVDPSAVLDGKNAIEVTFDGGRFSYWISPSTYQPLQSVDAGTRCPTARAAWESSGTRPRACSPGLQPRPNYCRCRPSTPTPPSITAALITRRPYGGCITRRTG
jgi:hypothetical protein